MTQTIAMIGSKGMPATQGGVERHVHDLSVRLALRGNHVTVYSRAWYTGVTPSMYEGVHLVYLPSFKTKHFDAITHAFLGTLHAMWHKVDVIHYHGVGPSLLAWIPRLFSPRTRVVATFHSIDRKHEKWGFFARFMLRMGEKAVCTFPHETISVSRTIAQYARDAYDRETVYIPNGVPLYTKTTTTNVLDSFGLKPQQYILFVSRLIAHKGPHYLIAAFQKLQKLRPDLVADKKLVIVGDGHYTDEYVSYLHGMAEGNPNIVFTGFQSGAALAELFSHTRLFVHPSQNEGLPITVLEAMSYEIPLLVSDIPEHRELVRGFGYTFTHGDAESLRRKLEQLLEETGDAQSIEAQNRRHIIEREYTWEALVPRIEEIYQKQKTATLSKKVAPIV